MKFIKIHDDAKIPIKAHQHDAGYDLYAYLDKPLVMPSLYRRLVPTGICVELDEGTCGQIWPRSGLAFKYGIHVLGGVIDCGYTGEVKVILVNLSDEKFIIEPDERIAQLLVVHLCLNHNDLLNKISERGENGFGSTG